MMNILTFVANNDNKQLNITKSLERNLLYTFKYRDLSKEAIMAIAESIIC